MTARCSRSRRHAHRGRGLSRSPRSAAPSFPGRATRSGCCNRAGFAVVVITNQSGVAPRPVQRGVRRTRCTRTSPTGSAGGGARIDGYYHCPHHPDAADDRRYRAATASAASRRRAWSTRGGRDLGLDLARSFMVGDAGATSRRRAPSAPPALLVRTGAGAREARRAGRRPARRCHPPQPRRGGRLDPAGASMSTRAIRRPRPIDRAAARMIDRFARCASRVIGDFVADEFVYGRVARVSREAPVLILEYDSTEIVPGGAGNAANNVAALGGGAARGRRGRRRRAGDAAASRRCTPASTRAAGPRRAAVGRRPRRASSPAASTRPSSRSCASIAARSRRADGGRARRVRAGRAAPRRRGATPCWSPTTAPAWSRRALVRRDRARRGRRRAARPPVLVDSRYDLARYRGLTACTPNEAEVEALLGEPIGDDVRALERAGRELLERHADGARC